MIFLKININYFDKTYIRLQRKWTRYFVIIVLTSVYYRRI